MIVSQGGYPAKLKKVLIVTAPLWFKAPFKILRLFVREKLRDRVFTVSIPQLTLHIPRESLPHRLGGTLEIQHEAWLLHCLKSMTNRGGGELCEVSPRLYFNKKMHTLVIQFHWKDSSIRMLQIFVFYIKLFFFFIYINVLTRSVLYVNFT